MLKSLKRIHSRRSSYARRMDESRRAKYVYKPTDKIGVERWKKHPNRYDIYGIDYPSKQPRRKQTTPYQRPSESTEAFMKRIDKINREFEQKRKQKFKNIHGKGRYTYEYIQWVKEGKITKPAKPYQIKKPITVDREFRIW